MTLPRPSDFYEIGTLLKWVTHPPPSQKPQKPQKRMLGLSASLLAGRTTGLPQLFPGPGQQSLVKQSLNLCSNTRFVLPLYWRQCNASIGCNAKGLILDFKGVLLPRKCSLFKGKNHKTMYSNGHLNPYRSIPVLLHICLTSLYFVS